MHDRNEWSNAGQGMAGGGGGFAVADTTAGDPLREIETSRNVPVDNKTKRSSDIKDLLRIYNVKTLAHATGNDDIVDNLRGLQQVSRWLLSSPYFDIFFCSLVVIDIVVICIDVDYSDEAPELFKTLTVLFAVIFAFELLVRICAHPSSVFERLMIYDTLLVALSIVDIFLTSQEESGSLRVDFSYFIVLRVARLCRVVRLARFIKGLYLLRILTEAINGSFYPLAMAVALTALTVLSFAITLTTIVPETKGDGEELFEEMKEMYGSVSRSCLSLLEGMSGASDWGTGVATKLFEAASENRFGSLGALICMFLAYFNLRLGLNGLVTAIFLEQLFQASDKEEEMEASKELLEQQELLQELDRTFASMGYGREEMLSWEAIKKSFEEHPQLRTKLRITMESARDLFEQLDEDGDNQISTDVFVFAMFKLRAMSKSVDMLSIDYQQEKALQRITQLHEGLRVAIAGIQSRLTTLFGSLPALEEDIEAVRRGMVEVQEYEAILQAKRADRKAVQEGTYRYTEQPEEAEYSTKSMSVEDLRETFDLNRRLTELEKAVDEILDMKEGTAENHHERLAAAEKHLGGVADGIVQSIQFALQQEIAAVRVMASEGQ